MSNDPFIERTFESGQNTVVVRWQQPTLEPLGEYKCRWSILWPNRVRETYTCGLDGVQALLLAMRSAHTELMESDLYKAGALTYADQYDLDLPSGWDMGPLYQPPEESGS